VGSFTIGTLARAADVSVETVRYYERRGLIEQPARSTGYRQYTDEDLRRLRFVRRAKQLGFTLTEIRELLDAADCRSVDGIVEAARRKVAAVDSRLEDLSVLRRRLVELVQTCRANDEDCIALQARAR
jgi:MerR family mercuric resistance operon transcriptional regulator